MFSKTIKKQLILGTLVLVLLAFPIVTRVNAVTTFVSLAVNDDTTYIKVRILGTSPIYIEIWFKNTSNLDEKWTFYIHPDAKATNNLTFQTVNFEGSNAKYQYIIDNFTKYGEKYTLDLYLSLTEVQFTLNDVNWAKTISDVEYYWTIVIKVIDISGATEVNQYQAAYTPSDGDYFKIYFIQTNSTLLDPPRIANFSTVSLGSGWGYREDSDALVIYYKSAPSIWDPLATYLLAIVIFFGVTGALIKLIEKITGKSFSSFFG